jgi:hypothetical protein
MWNLLYDKVMATSLFEPQVMLSYITYYAFVQIETKNMVLSPTNL